MRKGLALILIFGLVTTSITPLHGLAMETFMTYVGRCKCRTFTSSAFSPRQIKSIQVIPHGIRCRRTEVIITTTNDWKVCVHHNASWVHKLVKEVTKR